MTIRIHPRPGPGVLHRFFPSTCGVCFVPRPQNETYAMKAEFVDFSGGCQACMAFVGHHIQLYYVISHEIALNCG